MYLSAKSLFYLKDKLVQLQTGDNTLHLAKIHFNALSNIYPYLKLYLKDELVKLKTSGVTMHLMHLAKFDKN